MSRVKQDRRDRHLMTAALDKLPPQRRYIYIFTCLAGLTALQVMHLALNDMRLNLWLSAALLCGFVYSYCLEERWRGLTYYAVSALAVGVSLLYFQKINADSGMVGAYLGILLGILLVLQAFKAFSPSDHRFILMMCIVFLMYSSAACYDLKYMLAMPMMLVFAACAMYIASQVDVAVRVSQTTGAPLDVQLEFGRGFWPVLARAVGGTIGLSIAAYLLAPHGMRQDRPLQVAAAPRVGAADLEEADARRKETQLNPGGTADSYTGIGDDFDLSGGTRLGTDSTPVLQVKSHRNGYLRAQVYDVYTGAGWVQSPAMLHDTADPIPVATRADAILEQTASRADGGHATGRLMLPLRDFPSLDVFQALQRRATIDLAANNVFSQDQGLEPEVEVIRQEVKLLEPQPPYYFAIYQPAVLLNVATIRGSSDLIDIPTVDAGSAVRSTDLERWHPRGFGYTVESLGIRAGPKELAQVVLPGPRQILDRYTQLFMEDAALPATGSLESLGVRPEGVRPISRRLRNQALGITAALGRQAGGLPVSTWDKVAAIRDYLTRSEEFTYSREYESPPTGVEVTEYFLNQQRAGFCRQYASAMAVLCRLNGIPARVVTGFAPGSRSIIDNAFIYRNSNAHAWVEVYFDGYGWILFDPTPTSQTPFDTPRPLQYLQGAVDFLQELFVLDPAGTQQSIAEAFSDLWAFGRQHLAASAGALGLLTLAFGAALLWRRRPRRQPGSSVQPQNPVIGAWLETLATLGRLGLTARAGATARELGRLATASLPEAAIPLSRLLPLYERAAFSPQAPGPLELKAARACSSEIRQAVKDELERRKAAKRG